jgi:hypothetical protein
MIEKELTFPDLDGNQVTRKFAFHLNRADLVEIVAKTQQKAGEVLAETPEEVLRQLGGGLGVYDFLKEFLGSAVGKRSMDNTYFDQSPETRAAFMRSEAFATLMEELLSDDGAKVQAFINAVAPKSLQEHLPTQGAAPKPIMEKRIQISDRGYTEAELLAMEESAFSKVVKDSTKKGNVPQELVAIAMKRHTLA